MSISGLVTSTFAQPAVFVSCSLLRALHNLSFGTCYAVQMDL